MSNYKRAPTIRMIKRLMRSDCTARELQRVAGLSRPAVTKWLREFRAARLVFISGWRPIGGLAPIYGWGTFPDAPRPPRTTNTQRVATYRKKMAHDALRRAMNTSIISAAERACI